MRAKGLLSIIAVCVLLISTEALAQDRHSCSTFQMTSGDTIVVGHNLDDYVVFPGMMIDGGLNEAGLYIGEMTLMETIYPVIEGKPTFHTNLWMQYILDCYATVDEAIKNLPNYNLDGTCRWHFLLADASGNVSVIEFLKGRAIVYRGADVPHKILCNTTYQNDLDSLQRYVGYGGERAIDIQDKENTKRSVRAAEILKRYSDDPKTPIVDYSFDLLSLLDLGNNLWQITCDISNKRIYFRTQLNKNIKFVDFQSCDFSDTTLKYIDIHVDESHDVSSMCLVGLGGLLVAVGLATAIMAIGRGRRAWEEAKNSSAHSSRQAQLDQAYEARLRSAWRILAGIGVSALGGLIIALAIGER